MNTRRSAARLALIASCSGLAFTAASYAGTGADAELFDPRKADGLDAGEGSYVHELTYPGTRASAEPSPTSSGPSPTSDGGDQECEVENNGNGILCGPHDFCDNRGACPCFDDGGNIPAPGGRDHDPTDVAVGFPVDSVTGDKIESARDLVVKLTGHDFILTRGYTSNPGFDAAGLVGERWAMSAFAFLDIVATGGEPDLVLAGPPLREMTFEHDSGSEWLAGGPTDQYIVESSVTVGASTYATYELIEPGHCSIHFYRPHAGGGGITATPATHEGLLLINVDAYGNEQEHQYTVYGTNLTSDKHAARLTKVVCRTGDASPVTEAEIEFTWEDDDTKDNPGRLQQVSVKRGSTETQRLTYRYWQTFDDELNQFLPNALGTLGDLIEVREHVRVDNSTSDVSTWRITSTQYRYHGGEESEQNVDIDGNGTADGPHDSDGDGFFEWGGDHQLKMVIMPEQVEQFALARSAASGTDVASLEDGADVLLRLLDAADLYELLSGSYGSTVADVAAKVVNQYGNTVEQQFIQSDCSCGGATQSLKLDYNLYSYSHGAHSNGLVYNSMHIEESYWNGSSWVAHRNVYYDSGPPEDGGVSYILNTVIDDGAREWVLHFERDSATRALTKSFAPSATSSYTAGTPSVAPSYTASTTSGHVTAWSYNSDNRLLETRIGEGDQGAFSNFTLVSKNSWGDGTGTTRRYLRETHERYRVAGSSAANDVEKIEFDYAFHTTGGADLSSVEARVEAELVAENGPGGTYSSWELFDGAGRHHWSILPDGALVKRAHDSGTGVVDSVTRNAADTGLPSGSWGTVGRNSDGGALTTTYDLDEIGRVVRVARPSGAASYLRREMKDIPERTGIDHYQEVSLPVILDNPSAEYGGPASVTAYTASGEPFVSKQFSLAANGVTLTSGLATGYTTSTELARREVVNDLTGLVTGTEVWHDISGDRSYTTTPTYDPLGRLETSTSATGTITRYTYDVLDRVIEVEIGTSLSPDNLKTVTEYFYDSGGAATQGTGDGNLTLVRAWVDDSTYRDTIHTYDFRSNRIKTQNPLAPHTFTEYDNLRRPIASAVFSSVPTAIDAPLADRGRLTETDFSQRGRVYLTKTATDATQSSPTWLETNAWFDGNGRAIATAPHSQAATKTTYDGLGRVKVSYTTNRGGDAAPGASGNHADAESVSGDIILQQVEMSYIASGRGAGAVDLRTVRERSHDASTSDTGDLSGLASAKSIVSFSGSYFDTADRPIRAVNYGTKTTGFKHGGSAPTITQTSPPSASDADKTKLVTEIAYNTRGLQSEVTGADEAVSKTLYDDMGRRIAEIENYDNASVSWDSGLGRWEASGLSTSEFDTDRVTSFVYNGSGQITKRAAHYPVTGGSGEAAQVTTYAYGVTAGTGSEDSRLASNDMLASVTYPNGAGSDTETYAYNRRGERRFLEDEDGTKHAYTRDGLGRVTEDAITTFGSNIDQWADSIVTTYDDFGRIETVKTKDGSTILNAVKYSYTSLWQTEDFQQEPDGDIDGSTLEMSLAYDTDDAGVTNGNFTRISKLVYPDGSEFHHDYGSSGDLDWLISRAHGIRKDSASGDRVVEYDFIGMGRAALVDYPTPDFALDYTVAHNGSRTAGEYPGFDRFGRVVRQVWADGNLTTHATDTTVPNIPPIYEEEHSYDNAGNREKSYDVRPGASWDDREWWYEYDGLDRLVEARVGVDPEVRNQNWFPDPGSEAYDYDMIDNLGEHEVDWSGDGFYDDLDELKDAAFNANNELTGQEWEADPTDPSVSTPPTDDNQSLATGALYIYAQPEKTGETLPDITYTRDAWGRLVQVKYDTNARAEYEYNGLGHRTLAEVDTDAVPDGTVDELRLFFYDPQWRLLEERINDDSDAGSTIDRRAQQVWGLRYIDDAVMRREDGTANGSYANTSDGEWYYATDVLFSVVAVLGDTAGLQERVEYTPYGTALHHWHGDFDGDRDIDGGDSTALSNASGNSIGDPGYEVEVDLNRDGTIDLNDTPAAPPGGGSALPRGWASDPDSVDSMLARSSMLQDRRVDLQLARHRYYSAELARWLRTDPAQFDGGISLFVYCHSNPTTKSDPLGLNPCNCPSGTFCNNLYQRNRQDTIRNLNICLASQLPPMGIELILCIAGCLGHPTCVGLCLSAAGVVLNAPGIQFCLNNGSENRRIDGTNYCNCLRYQVRECSNNLEPNPFGFNCHGVPHAPTQGPTY